jgi:phospholipase/carboxylesterase
LDSRAAAGKVAVMAPSHASWAGLDVAVTGPDDPGERGGDAVVLLHGWGAPGDDLVPLAEALSRPRARFFVPAAPLPEVGGGRAWWHLDPGVRPEHAWDDQVPAGYQASQPVQAARAAVQELLRTIALRHAPDRLMIAGFSQGAMLALDVALAGEPAVERVAVLSGVLLVESVPALRAPRPRRPAVLVTHGRHDPVLAFEGGEQAQRLLRAHGFDVTWRPFAGGHDIPAETVAELERFLFGA